MKVAVVGSRLAKFGISFSYADFKREFDEFILRKGLEASIITIVSGGAEGIDTFAERWAKEHNAQTIILKPDWKNIGRNAGLIRNASIVSECDQMIAFLDKKRGMKSGTGHAIRLCKKTNKECHIVEI